MKPRISLTVLMFTTTAALLAAGAQARPDAAKPAAKAATDRPAAMPGMDAAAMEAMMKAAAPGPMHERLKVLEGNWTTTVKSSMDPSQAAMTSHGKSVKKMIFGGRYLQEDATGDFGGMAFMGMGLMGYDNLKKKYVSSWVDNVGTGILHCFGDGDGKTFTSTGTMEDPRTGKPTSFRMVTRVVSPDQHVFEWFEPGPDGKEAKTMEITYDRVK